MSGFALAEYEVPKFGLPNKVPGGTMPKDAGEFTSRLGQIKRQAAKCPGPGMYVGHKDWKLNRGFLFAKCARDKGLRMNKVPAPGHYENASSMAMTRPRSIGGQLSKGTKRSFLDNVAEKAGKTPAPDKYQPKFQEAHLPAPSFDIKKTESRMPKKTLAPGPGHYEPKYASIEKVPPNYGTSKETAKSFVDRVTKLKEKLPAPGHYEMTKLEKISRGTKWTQIMGAKRGPLMGAY